MRTQILSATLNNKGAVHHLLGEADRAVEYYTEALQLRVNTMTQADGTTTEDAHRIDDHRLEQAAQEERALLVRLSESRQGGHIDPFDPAIDIYGVAVIDEHHLPCMSEARLINKDGVKPLNDQHDSAVTLHNMALARYHQGHLHMAMKLFTMSIQVAEPSPREDSRELVLISLGSIALIEYQLGQEEEAIRKLSEAIERAESYCSLLEERQAIAELCQVERYLAKAYSILGRIFFSRGDYDHAKPCCEEALRLQEKSPEASELASAATRFNIGLVLHQLGEIETALIYCRRFIKVAASSFGERDHFLVSAIQCIGEIEIDGGLLDEALHTFSVCVDLKKDTYKRNDYARKDYAQSLFLYGRAMHESGDISGGKRLYAHALSLLLSLSEGMLQDECVAIQCRMAHIYRVKGELDEALTVLRDAVQTMKALHGNSSPSIVDVLRTIGVIYLEQREIGKAMDVFCEAERAIYRSGAGFGQTVPVLMYDIFHHLVLYALAPSAQAA